MGPSATVPGAAAVERERAALAQFRARNATSSDPAEMAIIERAQASSRQMRASSSIMPARELTPSTHMQALALTESSLTVRIIEGLMIILLLAAGLVACAGGVWLVLNPGNGLGGILGIYCFASGVSMLYICRPPWKASSRSTEEPMLGSPSPWRVAPAATADDLKSLGRRASSSAHMQA